MICLIYLKMESKGNKLLNEVEEILKKGDRKYTIEFKQKVLELIHLNYSLHFLSNKLGINRSLFRDWIKKEILILQVKNKDKKIDALISDLSTFFMRKKKILFITGLSKKEKIIFPVSTKSLISFASSLEESFKNKTLNAILQLAYRYIKGYYLSVRQISHKRQTIPEKKKL